MLIISIFLCSLIHLYKAIFFPNTIIYTLNIASAMKKMIVNELRDLDNYCKRIGFVKESSYYFDETFEKKDLLLLATKLIEKKANPSIRYYNSYLKRKSRKSVKQSKLITQQLKNIENPNIIDTKSSSYRTSKDFLQIIQYCKTDQKCFPIGSGKSSNSPL